VAYAEIGMIMKPYQQLRGGKASERIYSGLVSCYPSQFRAEFGKSMRQVFRDQCLDAIRRNGTLGLIALWLRVLPDFVWTCPKEHVMALPTLARFVWAEIRPLWRVPALLAGMWLLLIVMVTLLQRQYYASTAIIEVKRKPAPGGAAAEFDPYFLQSEFEKLASKTVLYPVIEKLDLQSSYGGSLKLPAPLSIEATYRLLRNDLSVAQYRNTELIKVTVFNEDKTLAMRAANEIVTMYWGLSLEALARNQPNESQFQSAESVGNRHQPKATQKVADVEIPHRIVTIINSAEEGLRPTRPNRYLNIVLGGVTAMAIGGIFLFVLWVIRRNRQRIPVAV
jgi:uncharacterized protein involved in exopolysaccharide biosynthesis